MTHENNTTSGAPQIVDKAEEFIYAYLNATAALYWQINIIKNKIRYLNDHRIPGFGNMTLQLLQNMPYAQTVILEKDVPLFQSFMKAIKGRKAASVLLRAKAEDGTMRWLKLSGWPDPYKSACCFGVISEETNLVGRLLDADHDASSIQTKVNLFTNPVFVANFSDKKIIAANRPLHDAIPSTDGELPPRTLDEILAGNDEAYRQSIYESLIFDQKWSGNITLEWAPDAHFSARASIRAVTDLGQNMLWISLHSLTGHAATPPPPVAEPIATPAPAIVEIPGVDGTESMEEMLSLLLSHQPQPALADALIYSDVDVAHNTVTVYGGGADLTALAPGFTHPYEGSIAENILNFRLDHLLLCETTESIKPIDWALFIPMGIHSYYAKPFYEKGTLTTVLIFCSSIPATFTEENVTAFESLYPAFLQGLDRWKAEKQGRA